MNDKPKYVAFRDKKLEDSFEKLKEGKFQDKKLYEQIDEARKKIKQDPSCATKVPKGLWPKLYIKAYGITNLWKYDLPSGWRLIYTIKTDEVMILSIILEWMIHKEYERRFKY